RVVRVVDDHGGVLVERDRGAVVSPVRLLRPDNDSLHDLALFDRALRRRRLHGSGDHVTHPRIAALGATFDPDAEDLARARLVRGAGDDDAAALLAPTARVLRLRQPGDRAPLCRALALRLRVPVAL